MYPHSSAYERRVASFAIAPDAARRLAEGARTRQDNFWGPAAIIDREYLFTKPYKYARIDLTGIYVNGDSGRAERRQSVHSLPGGILTGFPSKLPPGWEAQPAPAP